MEDTRHYKLAQKTLRKAEDFLVSRGWKVTKDKWPYHIIVEAHNRNLSIYCGGFSTVLELMPLNRRGTSDKRYNERSFESVEDLYIYIESKWVPLYKPITKEALVNLMKEV